MKIIRVYEQVRDFIENEAHQLMPGEYLSSELKYARELGVSRLTVRKAVDELVKNGIVRRLLGKGLIVSDGKDKSHNYRLLFSMQYQHEDSDYFQTLLGCIDTANRLDLDYRILSANDTGIRLDMIQNEDLSHYDAIIFSCYYTDDDLKALGILHAAKKPIIMVGDNTDGDANITVDCFNGGYMIGEYLLRHGHKDIVFLTSNRSAIAVRQRTNGFLQALGDNHVNIRSEYIVSVEDPGMPLLLHQVEQRVLPPEVERFYNRELPISALTGYSTIPILSMLAKMYKYGFRVPDDISVVGYGNTPYFVAQEIPLTAVMSPNFEKGSAAVECAYNYLSGKTRSLVSKILPVSFTNNNTVRSI